MREAMPECGAQRPQPERLAEHVRMDRDVADERMAPALIDHLLELVDDHVAELPGAWLAVHHHGRVVDFHRVGYREDRPRARSHPYRLVVARPVHQVRVAGFLEQVGRHGCFVRTRAHPARRAFFLVAREGLRHFADQALLVRFPKAAQVLGVGAAVRHDLVAAGADSREDLRRVVVEQAVGVVRERQLQFVGKVEEAPDPHAVAVVAPGIVALRLRLAALRVVVSEACAEGEALDVGGEAEREALAARPGIVFPLRDRRVVVARMPRQEGFCHERPRFQSARAPESLTTLPSLAMSARIWAANCSGVLAIGVAAWVAKKSRISAESTTFANSALMRARVLTLSPARCTMVPCREEA